MFALFRNPEYIYGLTEDSYNRALDSARKDQLWVRLPNCSKEAASKGTSKEVSTGKTNGQAKRRSNSAGEPDSDSLSSSSRSAAKKARIEPTKGSKADKETEENEPASVSEKLVADLLISDVEEGEQDDSPPKAGKSDKNRSKETKMSKKRPVEEVEKRLELEETKSVGEAKEEEDEEEEEDYEVEKIIDKKGSGRTLKYLVKWKGWDNEEDQTWEPVRNLNDAKEMIREFEESMKEKGSGKKKKEMKSPVVAAGAAGRSRGHKPIGNGTAKAGDKAGGGGKEDGAAVEGEFTPAMCTLCCRIFLSSKSLHSHIKDDHPTLSKAGQLICF